MEEYIPFVADLEKKWGVSVEGHADESNRGKVFGIRPVLIR
jgi:hypothetical protein